MLEQQSLKTKSILALVILAASAFADDNAPNRLTPEEQAEGFVLLFNGRDLNGWKGDEKLW